MNGKTNDIIIVDDTPENLMVLQDILIANGYRVRLFPKAILALNAAIKEPPDLFLIDIVMPDMDGFELCKQLKAHKITKAVPVIYISAHDDENNILKAFNSGAIDYITKPIREPEVLARIKTHLKLIKAEKNLQNLNNELEIRVQDRTMKLDKANKKLKENNKLLEKVLNSTNELIFVLNKDCSIYNISNNARKMLNISEKDLKNKNIFKLLPAISTKLFKEKLNSVIGQKQSLSFEVNDTDAIYEYNMYPIIDDANNIEKIVVYNKDITIQRSTERKIINRLEEERRNIGQILHDSIGQKLTGISYMTNGLQKSLSPFYNDNELIANDFELFSETISDIINEVRSISRGLNPVQLSTKGLINALTDLAFETEKMFKIPCSVNYNNDIKINDKTTISSLYYITREAINNAIKHGKTSSICININEDNNFVFFNIMNKGKLTKNNSINNGIGLQIMKYRANIIGGEFHAGSIKDGYSVEIKIRTK